MVRYVNRRKISSATRREIRNYLTKRKRTELILQKMRCNAKAGLAPIRWNAKVKLMVPRELSNYLMGDTSHN